MYFYDCEMDQHRSKHLGIDPISDVMIMTATLGAFSKENHGEQQLQCIAEGWDLANANANSPQDQYEQFKDHYNWRLADLYNHNCNTSPPVANHTHAIAEAIADHNDRLFDLESQWQEIGCIH